MPNENWKAVEDGKRLQAEILNEIERFQRDWGYSPTRAELGKTLGRSDVVIGKHIKKLVEEGRLTEGNGPRTLAFPI